MIAIKAGQLDQAGNFPLNIGEVFFLGIPQPFTVFPNLTYLADIAGLAALPGLVITELLYDLIEILMAGGVIDQRP